MIFSRLKELRLLIVISLVLMAVALSAGAALSSYFSTMSALSSATTDPAVTFFALGDHGAGTLKQKFVARWLEQSCRNSQRTDFVLFLGDNFYPEGVDSVEDRKWQSVFEEVYDSRCLSEVPFYASLGNHDHLGNAAAQIEYGRSGRGSGRWKMSATHYMQDFRGGGAQVRLVVLDTEAFKQEEQADRQLALLDEAFSIANPKIWRLVAGHVPVRSFSHRYGDSPLLVRKLLPKLRQHRVDVYLSAHAHNLQMISRPNEPFYVISGGGAKRPRPLSAAAQSDPSLIYGNPTLGFAAIVAERQVLKVLMVDALGGTIEKVELTKRLDGLSVRYGGPYQASSAGDLQPGCSALRCGSWALLTPLPI